MREEKSFFEIALENGEREITETTGQTVKEWKGQGDYIRAGFASDAARYTAKRTGTGLQSIDGATGGGLAGGRVYVISGIAGTGKTTLALQIAHAIAKTQKALYIACEQSRFELTAKAIASHARKTVEQIITESDEERARDAAEYAKEYGNGLEILEIAGDKTEQIYIERKAEGAALVVFDYLQIMPRDAAQNVKEGVENNITFAKRLAVKTGAAVIVISAMNRASYASAVKEKTETAEDKRAALLGGMKESGAIEYTADFVGVIEWSATEKTSLQIVKNRYGQTGEAALTFEKDLGVFRSRETEQKRR